MSVEVLRTYRYRCDATGCNATALTEDGAPLDWTVVSSIAHQNRLPLPSVKSPRARLAVMSADGVRTTGQFKLHLCPVHPDAFASHLPQTDNPGGQGVTVSCSCGARLGFMPESPRAVWREHFEETSRAMQAQGQTSPIKGDQMT